MSLARLDTLAAALRRLPDALEEATADTVRANRHVLEDVNAAQLQRGRDADDQPIQPEYAALTRELKQLKGQPADRVTLRDEGDFYAGIVAEVRGNVFEIIGTDAKTQALTDKYGRAVVGLTDDALAEFRDDYVRPELQAQTRELLST